VPAARRPAAPLTSKIEPIGVLPWHGKNQNIPMFAVSCAA